MALTVRTNGSGGSNIITASWWNDYYNLLTGAMTDQPVTLSYAPGSAGATPTVKLVTNGNAPLLQGYNGATQEFSFDASGNLTMLGQLLLSNGGTSMKVGNDGTNLYFDNPAGTRVGQFKTTGLWDGSGTHAYTVMVGTGSATAGRQIFVGTTTPTGANEGDIWIKA